MVLITWLGHSSFELKLDSGEVIVCDPWVDGNPRYPAGRRFTRIDTILVSHGHSDHFASVVSLARQFSSKVIGIYEVCLFVKHRGVENISPMNKGGSQMAGTVKVTMTHALHSSGIEDEDGKVVYGGEAAGYVLGFGDGRRAYFAGDTGVFSDMSLIRELYRPELAFLPIGGLFTMDPEEAALAVRLLGVKTVIPMHWGTFPALAGRPEELAGKVLGSGCTVRAMQPGESIEW